MALVLFKEAKLKRLVYYFIALIYSIILLKLIETISSRLILTILLLILIILLEKVLHDWYNNK